MGGRITLNENVKTGFCKFSFVVFVLSLLQHTGCVNTIEWHPKGHELLSSGDDLDLAIWDSHTWNLKGVYRTGHTRNVFGVKYIPHQDNSFITCGADGDVRLTDLVKQEDNTIMPRVEVLSSNFGDMTLKIEFLPLSPMSFLVTHQDGTIRLTDLRNARNTGTAGIFFCFFFNFF